MLITLPLSVVPNKKYGHKYFWAQKEQIIIYLTDPCLMSQEAIFPALLYSPCMEV